MTSHDSNHVAQLNALLRHELSAVETYRHALEKARNGPARETIEKCCSSHEQHVAQLSDLVSRRGGTPAQGAGLWGSLVKLVEEGAAAFGTKALVSALEEGEEHGLRHYMNTLAKLDLESREVIESEMLHDQRRNLGALVALKATLA